MLFEILNSIGLLVLGGGLLAATLVAAEFGILIGRRASKLGADTDASGIATACLGLLALLIAFTYSMAVARYDLRRQVVLEEANAIGSTANFALMLPQPDQAPILDMLRRYTQVRLDLGVPYDEAKFQQDVGKSTQLQAQLWQRAVSVTAAMPQSLPAYRFVASLNEMNNIGEKRLNALSNHMPTVIFLMLAGTALISMGFAGYSAGVSGVNRHISMVVLGVLLTFLIILTQDLARPDRGAIEVSTQALQDALAGIPSPTK